MITMTEKIAVERMRWKMARFCWEHISDPDFDQLCVTLRIPVEEAKRLALEFAHG